MSNISSRQEHASTMPRSTQAVIIRPARLSDIPAIAEAYDASMRLMPMERAKYGSCTSQEFQRYVREMFAVRLRDKSKRCWVAIDPLPPKSRKGSDPLMAAHTHEHTGHVADGHLAGVLVYQRKGLGDVEGVADWPTPKYPEGTDLECITKWREDRKALDEAIEDAADRYIRGDVLAVSPAYQDRRIGSKLCEALARDAEEAGIDSVFMTTTKNSMPFYDRFCFTYGYLMTHIGNPVRLASDLAVIVYTVKLQKQKMDPFGRARREMVHGGTLRRA